MSSSSVKTWSDFTPKYRREIANGLADNIMGKCASLTEAAGLLQHVVERIQRITGQRMPSFHGEAVDNTVVAQHHAKSLLESLATLRAKHANHHSQLHLPRVAVHEIDTAVLSTGLSLKALQSLHYGIGEKQYKNVVDQGRAPLELKSTVGRKSKIANEDLVKQVGALLAKHSNDSSKVVSVRQGGIKMLVCARLLSKKMWRIWKAEPDLREKMSWSTFRKISKARFPQFRPPGRKTDVCSHCKTLKRRIAPKAFQEYKKRRAQITEHCPQYFEELDSAPSFAELVRADKIEDIVVEARRFINGRNNRAGQDPQRRDLPLAARMSLFDAEARSLHKLKGHCELLEAYQWHKTTATRQQQQTARVLEHLTDSEAYMHFDFKENVRYPMSKEETGDEWHAQNKLSLTVFGCVVHTPGRRNMNFLLVSEVLDHDSQMARLLLTQVLKTVHDKAEYRWSQVKTLHLVCDCGPHFRSREGYAFFLHDLPKRWKVNVSCLHCPLTRMFPYSVPSSLPLSSGKNRHK